MKLPRFVTRPASFVGRTLKRLWKVTAFLVVLAVLLRVAIAFATPVILKSVLGGLGFDVRWSQWHIAMIEGEVLFRDLELSNRETQERFVDARYARVRISWTDLLKGEVVVQRIDLDRATIDLRRQPDGRLALLATLPPAEDEPPVAQEPEEPRGLFDLPLALLELRLQRTTIRWRDETHDPPIVRDLAIDLRADDLASSRLHPVRADLHVASSDGWFETELAATIHLERNSARAELDLRKLSVQPHALEPWLDGTGLSANAAELVLSASLEAALTHDLDTGLAGRLLLKDVALRPDGDDAILLDRLEAGLRQLDAQAIELGQIRLEGVRVRAARETDGHLRFAGFTYDPATRVQAADAPAQETSRIGASEPRETTAGRFAIDEIRVENTAFHLRQGDPRGAKDLALVVETFRTSRIDFAAGALAQLTYEVRAGLPGLVERIDLTGSLAHAPAASETHAQMTLHGVNPTTFETELREQGVTTRWKDLGGALTFTASRKRDEHDVEHLDARLEGVTLQDDHVVLAKLDRLELVDLQLGADARRVEKIAIVGVDLTATRKSDGTWHVLGVDLAPSTAMEGRDVPNEPTVAVAREMPTAPPTPFFLEALETRDVDLTFVDESVQPRARIALADVSLRLDGFATEAREDGSTTQLELTWTMPELLERARLTGSFADEGERRRVQLDLSGAGLNDGPLRPYLGPLGLELERVSSTFDLRAEVRFDREDPANGSTDLLVTRARIGDPRDPDLDLQDLRVEGIESSWDTEHERPVHHVENLSLQKLQVRARGTADGTWRALGWRYRPPASRTNEIQGPSPRTETAPPSSGSLRTRLPVIELPSVALQEITFDVGWRDDRGREFLQPITMGLATHSLVFDPLAERVEPTSRYEFTLNLPGTIEESRIEGELGASLDAVAVNGNLDLRGMTFERLQTLFEDHGLRWVAPEATFHTAFHVEAGIDPTAVSLTTQFDDLNFAHGDRRWLSLDTCRIDGLRLEDDELALRAFTLERPYVYASFADGATTALGLRMEVPKASPAPEASPAPTRATGSQQPVIANERAPMDIAFENVTVRDARIDIAHPPGLARDELVVTSDLALQALEVRERGDGATLDWTIQLQELLDEVHVHGTVAPHRRAGELALQCDLRGVRGRLLESVLPTMHSSLEAGDLSFLLGMDYALDPGTRTHAGFSVRQADYRERGSDTAFLSFDELALRAESNADGTFWKVTDARWAGLETLVERAENGDLEVFGLRLPQQPVEGSEHVAPERNAHANANVSDNALIGPTLPPGFRKAPRRSLPALHFEAIDLELRRLRFFDRAKPDLEPTDSSMRLYAQHAFELFNPSSNREFVPNLVAEGNALPIVKDYRLTFEGELFALAPHASLKWKLEGFDGSALLDTLPNLREHVVGSDLEAATFEGEAAFQLELDRRDPFDFDLSRPFSLRFDVSRVSLHDPVTGIEHLGVDGWSVEADPVDLTRREIIVTRVEMYHPVLDVRRTAEGLEVPGFTLRLPEPATDAQDATSTTTRSAGPRVASEATPEETPWLVRIDDAALFAGEFTYTDTTCKLTSICEAEGECGGRDDCRHVLHFPVNDLTFQASGITSRPKESTQPLTFEFSVNGRPITLRKRKSGIDLLNVGDTLSFFTNVVGDVTGLDTAKFEYESRPIFNSIRGKGSLDLREGTVGDLEFHVDDFELFALAGLAKKSSVDINDGVVRSDVGLKFRKNGTIALDSVTVFSDLDLSEPAGGPIQQYLGLDTPVNQVIALLRDDRGQHRIPVRDDNLTEMSQGKVIGLVAEVLVDLIARAALSSPSRVFKIAVDLTGSIARRIPLVNDVWDFVFGAPPTPEELAPIVFEFAPGDASVPREAEEAMRTMLERLSTFDRMYVVVRHRSGQDDLDRVAKMAKPSARDREDYLERLTLESRQLEYRRNDLLEQLEQAIRGQQRDAVNEARANIQEIDDRLGQIELTFDQLYRLRDIGPDLAQERKARDLSSQLASLRLERVHEAIFETLALDIENLDQRVRFASPTLSNPLPCGGGYIIIEPRLMR